MTPLPITKPTLRERLGVAGCLLLVVGLFAAACAALSSALTAVLGWVAWVPLLAGALFIGVRDYRGARLEAALGRAAIDAHAAEEGLREAVDEWCRIHLGVSLVEMESRAMADNGSRVEAMMNGEPNKGHEWNAWGRREAASWRAARARYNYEAARRTDAKGKALTAAGLLLRWGETRPEELPDDLSRVARSLLSAEKDFREADEAWAAFGAERRAAASLPT